MHARRIWLTAFAALGAAGARSGELTDLPPASGAGIERGVALVQCALPGSDIQRLSRATVIEIGSQARADVLLTTAHGLPSTAADIERDCRVLVRGKEYAIRAAWHAGGHAAGPEHDWTVLRLAERIKGDLLRWRAAEIAASWLDELVAARAPVRLVLRYADAAQSDCRLESWTAQGMLAYSCVSYPGTSGSPLAVGIDFAPVLIAMHVGSELNFDGIRLDMQSVARPLDASIMAAIDAAAADAAQPPQGRRRH